MSNMSYTGRRRHDIEPDQATSIATAHVCLYFTHSLTNELITQLQSVFQLFFSINDAIDEEDDDGCIRLNFTLLNLVDQQLKPVTTSG